MHSTTITSASATKYYLHIPEYMVHKSVFDVSLKVCLIMFFSFRLYLGASVLDHSCQPNAVVIFKGKELIVRTIEDVENISDIRVSYTNLLDNTEKRRQNLSEQYYFYCGMS